MRFSIWRRDLYLHRISSDVKQYESSCDPFDGFALVECQMSRMWRTLSACNERFLWIFDSYYTTNKIWNTVSKRDLSTLWTAFHRRINSWIRRWATCLTHQTRLWALNGPQLCLSSVCLHSLSSHSGSPLLSRHCIYLFSWLRERTNTRVMPSSHILSREHRSEREIESQCLQK